MTHVIVDDCFTSGKFEIVCTCTRIILFLFNINKHWIACMRKTKISMTFESKLKRGILEFEVSPIFPQIKNGHTFYVIFP